VGTAVLTLLVAVPLRAQFEGTMNFVTHSPEGDGTLTQITKGTRTRYDFSGAGDGGRSGSMIYDSATRTRTMLLPARKMYLTMTGDPPSHGNEPKSDIAWTRTGKMETVAGVKCEIYHGSGTRNGKPQEGDVCVAKGVGLGVNGGGPLASAMRRYSALKLAPDQGIVKASTVVDGKPQVELELTKVTRGGVTDADFAIPAGYTQLQPGAMQPAGPPPGAGPPKS
jgi:hypothetical protein